jgi:propionyl-CoA carboxylase alpha chain/3-methylcrotonyl-CoA carboxylase alpha subunit/acetyl-CoA/propionyl-CoA carboxylase biotin carboxyl carrier protein
MFESILIANRGEIACRVIRTAKELGIETIAVYHHVDRMAPHVKAADRSVELLGDTPTAAYLDIEQIIKAANETKAQCLHPGYGFLSENAAFAEAVEKNNIVFVGPRPEVIKLMGDKIISREFARKAGIPIAPSVTQTDDLSKFLKEAEKIGFPLLIKASAGGGGKGMSIVNEVASLEKQAKTAMSEAERYFADSRIYAELYVENPRHIEVQILGDGRGNIIHAYERECSIQRRFQKVIEESPAPALSVELRDQICAAAVDLASKAKYLNAGTVEFILSPDGSFYFLEMNTRLQVEHPVTEMVCSLDLVKAQLHIAASKTLPYKQSEIKQSGHAIECRICCEEPHNDFRPATGDIKILSVPVASDIRFDSGIAQGQTISAAFDSMIGKLICFGEDRDAAIKNAIGGLNDLVILGVSSNIDYLGQILKATDFKEMIIDTGFLEKNKATLLFEPLSEKGISTVATMAALSLRDFKALALETPEPYASMGAWRNL